jgi:hypothetical protein
MCTHFHTGIWLEEGHNLLWIEAFLVSEEGENLAVGEETSSVSTISVGERANGRSHRYRWYVIRWLIYQTRVIAKEKTRVWIGTCIDPSVLA